MYMRLKDGKKKVFTLSYDDGVVQDIRLIKLMDQYAVKGTFNINSGCYLPEEQQRERYYGRMKRSEAVALFQNSSHEVAIHGYAHAELPQLRGVDLLNEIREDRLAAERDYGTIVRGMAYAFGAYTEESLEAMKLCGICYSRTTTSTTKFRFPENWLTWHPTCHHKNPRLMELAKQFAEKDLRYPSECRLFYLWGHTYEFADDNNWDVIENFAEKMGGRDDIWYATNMELYYTWLDYQRLESSADGSIIHNPSVRSVWIADRRQNIYEIKPGETINIL